MLLWALAAVPAALLVYTLLLWPFTPAISDIRKAKTEQPAQLVSADGRLLAEYRWVNREWVALEDIAPSVVDALIATEDHRFYDHFGLDWRRTGSALIRTLGRQQAGRIDHHAAAGSQSLPRGRGPRPHADAQAQGKRSRR